MNIDLPYSNEPCVVNNSMRRKVLAKMSDWCDKLPGDVQVILTACPTWTIPYFMTIMIRHQQQGLESKFCAE